MPAEPDLLQHAVPLLCNQAPLSACPSLTRRARPSNALCSACPLCPLCPLLCLSLSSLLSSPLTSRLSCLSSRPSCGRCWATSGNQPLASSSARPRPWRWLLQSSLACRKDPRLVAHTHTHTYAHTRTHTLTPSAISSHPHIPRSRHIAVLAIAQPAMHCMRGPGRARVCTPMCVCVWRVTVSPNTRRPPICRVKGEGEMQPAQRPHTASSSSSLRPHKRC